MSPHTTDRHLEEYETSGYTVFRGIIPPDLLAALRRACAEGREEARRCHGRQVQRFQPVARYDLDPEPFRAFRELPELVEAVRFVLGDTATFGDPDQMGVLLEPGDQPYCTRWHRDWRDNAPWLDYSRWHAAFADRRYFNQSNCPLYADHSLWVVPGSHLRAYDLRRERELFPVRPVPEPDWTGLTPEERERTALIYVRSMPGARQVHLEAGDYLLYRNTLWHLGNYVPYVRRATLHDFVDTPEYAEFRRAVAEEMSVRRAAGLPEWEWCHAPAAVSAVAGG